MTKVVNVIKLSSGEEIIAEVNTESGYLKAIRPCAITYRQEGGRVKTDFWRIALNAKDDEIAISPDAVVYSAEASEASAQTYLNMFNKIAVPQQKLVVAGS